MIFLPIGRVFTIFVISGIMAYKEGARTLFTKRFAQIEGIAMLDNSQIALQGVHGIEIKVIVAHPLKGMFCRGNCHLARVSSKGPDYTPNKINALRGWRNAHFIWMQMQLAVGPQPGIHFLFPVVKLLPVSGYENGVIHITHIPFHFQCVFT